MAAVTDPSTVKLTVADEKKPAADEKKPAADEKKPAAKESLKDKIITKFVVFVNPKFTKFNRPCIVAVLVATVTLVIWLTLLNSMLKNCTIESKQTTSRSELIDFLTEMPGTSFANSIHNNNKLKNLNCIYYTAKLTQTAGSVKMLSDWQNSQKCTYAGKNWHHHSVSGGAPYTYDGRGKQYNLDGSTSWRSDAEIPGNQWMKSGKNTDNCPGSADWIGTPGLLRYQKCDPGTVQKSPDGAIIEGSTTKKAYVWVRPALIKTIPGGMSQYSKYRLPKSHPMNTFIRSAPWLGWGAEERPSAFPSLEDTYKYDRGDASGCFNAATTAGKKCSTTDQVFTMTDNELTQLLTMGENDDNVVRLTKQNATSCNGPCSASEWDTLRKNIYNYEIKLYNRDAIDYRDWEPDSLQWEGKFITRDKLCNKEDFDEYILYKNTGADCRPGGYYWKEHGGNEDAMISDKRCTVLRRCDLTNFDENDFTATQAQSEYGAFLVSYQLCPDFAATLGASLGYTGQIEFWLTVFFLSILMLTGVVQIKGENGDAPPKGWKAMLKKQVSAAMATAEAPDSPTTKAIKELKAKEKERAEREAKLGLKEDGKKARKPSLANIDG